ncbi:MAG: hypothetical protein LAO76_24275 [Acidobacteriia bacterium]|nr:hypothetical protein [Terriglobia bacterium]
MKCWLTLLASLIVGACFFALRFLAFAATSRLPRRHAGRRPWRWQATIPYVLGFSVALRCISTSAGSGAVRDVPVALPQRLMSVGFYRNVRNPIYIGLRGRIGLWTVFGSATTRAVIGVFL